MSSTVWVYGHEVAEELGALSAHHLLMFVTNWNKRRPDKPIPRKRGWYGRDELLEAWNTPQNGVGAKRGVRQNRRK